MRIRTALFLPLLALPLPALAAYQEGSELVRFCQARLAEVEQKLQVLDSGVERELVLEQDE